MFESPSIYFRVTTCLALFFIPAFILTTPNYSVLLLALLVIYCAFNFIAKFSSISLSNFDFIVLLCLSAYFIIYIPIVLVTLETPKYFSGGIRILLCAFIYLVFSRLKNLDEMSKYLILGIFFGSTGAFALALYEHFILHYGRVEGFLYSINFGYVSASLALLSLTYCYDDTWKKWGALSFIFSTIATLLTVTRGSIYALPVLIVLCLFFYSGGISYRKRALILVVLIASIVTTYSLSSTIQNRTIAAYSEIKTILSGKIVVDYESSSAIRLQLWIGAIKAFEASPMIGSSYKTRENINQELYTEGVVGEYVRDLPRGHAHNQYFEMLASSGVLSIYGITMMLLVPFAMFTSHFRKTNSIHSRAAAIFIAGFMIFGMTEVPLQGNLISCFYGFMLSTFFAIMRVEKYHNGEPV